MTLKKLLTSNPGNIRELIETAKQKGLDTINVEYFATNRDVKVFSARDGLGIEMLHQAGIKTGLISGRVSPIVEYRANELGIQEINQGIKDKKGCFNKILEKHTLTKEEVSYIGDDLIDLPILLEVGLSAAASDAHYEVLNRVHWICQSPGGKGAVREMADLIIKAQGKWEEFLSYYCNRS